MKRYEELYGVKLSISESYTAKVDGQNIFIHPKYEMVTRQVIKEMRREWPSFGLGPEALTEENLLKHLKVFIPVLS